MIHQQDKEGELFRKIAEQGHYAGRTKPTATRQGLYIATADGDLLSSRNTTRASHVLGLIGRGLAAWDKRDPEQIEAYANNLEPDKNFAATFPDGAMVLRQIVRDLPRTTVYRQDTWRHNFDHVWLTRAEVEHFVPSNMEPGTRYEIPSDVIGRIAQFHFVDQVNGEADPYTKDEVESANLRGKVIETDGSLCVIRLDGNSKCVKPSTGETNPFSGQKITQPRIVDVQIRGWLTYDSAKKSFRQFDMLAFGQRSGAAVYNFRYDDLGPAPIGFHLQMIPSTPENRVRPKFLNWRYFD